MIIPICCLPVWSATFDGCLHRTSFPSANSQDQVASVFSERRGDVLASASYIFRLYSLEKTPFITERCNYYHDTMYVLDTIKITR